MGGLLSYSGITTKVRAMQSHLITDSQFREMAAMETVADALDYLKRLPAYNHIFSDLESMDMHRGTIEQRLILSQYEDFTKLYRFANLPQRKFLDLYFMHYEINILKKCFRNALGHQKIDIDLSVFQDFFEKHSSLNLLNLYSSENLQEFKANLEGSIYYDLLAHLDDVEKPNIFDYEIHMDLMYFNTLWKMKNKFFSHGEQKMLTACFGSKLDLLNIQWIYRSKKYYRLTPADIYALLIPVNYKLSRDQITKMAEAASVDEFYQVLMGTCYGKILKLDSGNVPDLEKLSSQITYNIHNRASRKNPYSIAILNSYLYFKEDELQSVITVIESIRYNIDPDEIISYITKL